MKDEPHDPGRPRAYFFLGIFVATVIFLFMHLASALFWHNEARRATLITGDSSLEDIVQIDWKTFWQFRPNLKDKEVTERLADETGRSSTYRYSTNELGFRSPPIKTPKPPFRILAIGDSTTFGQHLSDSECWPAQLQQMMDPSGEKVEVINAGVIGASSFQGVSFLITQGLSLQPNLVIATFGFNDWGSANISDRNRARIYAERGIVGMVKRGLYFFSNKSQATVPRATPGEYLDHLFFMSEVCEKHNVPLLFLIWPNPWEVKEPVGQMSRYKPYIQDVCRITQAECLDLQTVFASATEPTHLDCIHGTALGCRLVAEALDDYIRGTYDRILQ